MIGIQISTFKNDTNIPFQFRDIQHIFSFDFQLCKILIVETDRAAHLSTTQVIFIFIITIIVIIKMVIYSTDNHDDHKENVITFIADNQDCVIGMWHRISCSSSWQSDSLPRNSGKSGNPGNSDNPGNSGNSGNTGNSGNSGNSGNYSQQASAAFCLAILSQNLNVKFEYDLRKMTFDCKLPVFDILKWL